MTLFNTSLWFITSQRCWPSWHLADMKRLSSTACPRPSIIEKRLSSTAYHRKAPVLDRLSSQIDFRFSYFAKHLDMKTTSEGPSFWRGKENLNHFLWYNYATDDEIVSRLDKVGTFQNVVISSQVSGRGQRLRISIRGFVRPSVRPTVPPAFLSTTEFKFRRGLLKKNLILSN